MKEVNMTSKTKLAKKIIKSGSCLEIINKHINDCKQCPFFDADSYCKNELYCNNNGIESATKHLIEKVDPSKVFVIGDKVKTKKWLIDSFVYGGVIFRNRMRSDSFIIESINNSNRVIAKNGCYYSFMMLKKVEE
jgi:hypothetical protein